MGTLEAHLIRQLIPLTRILKTTLKMT